MYREGAGFAGVVSQRPDVDQLLTPLTEKLKYRGDPITSSLKSGAVRLAQIGREPKLLRRKEGMILSHGCRLNQSLEKVADHLIDRPTALNEISGHFALAVVLPEEDRLLLTRDLFGTRPLFYLNEESYFAFSSDLQSLTTLKSYNKSPNQSFLRNYVIYYHYDNVYTRYEGINRVPAGGIIEYNMHSGRTSTEMWIQPKDLSLENKEASILFGNRLKKVVERAVKENRACIQVSGGLDSSSIASIASEIEAEDGREAEYYSVTYKNEIPEESYCLNNIELEKEIKITRYSYESIDNFTGIKSDFLPKDVFYSPFYLMHLPIFKNLKQENSDLVITGIGGDEVTGASFYNKKYYYHLKNLKLKSLLHEALVSFNNRWFTNFLGTFVTGALLPLTDTGLGISRNTGISGEDNVPFFAKKGLKHTYNNTIKSTSIDNIVHKSIYSSLTGSSETLEALDKIASSEGLSTVHPFQDRRLFDIVLSVDVDSLFRPGETKSLLRDSLRDCLPEKILSRRTKSGYDLIYRDEIRKNYSYIRDLIEFSSYSPDYLDLEKVIRFMEADSYETSIASLNSFWRLLKVFHWYELQSFD